MICEIENSTNYLQGHKIWFSRVIIIFIKRCNFRYKTDFVPVASSFSNFYFEIFEKLSNFRITFLSLNKYPDLNPKTQSFLWKKWDF